MTQRTARGTGLSTVTVDGTTLDAWYPRPVLDPADGPDPDETAFQSGLEAELAALAGVDEARGVRTVVVSTVVDLDAPPQDTADAYLRLHLLSHRLVAPHGQNLEGIFGVLPNVVWTDRGPCPVEGFETTRRRLLARDGVLPTVHGVDKFPRMVDYVVPSGVRIADGDRVRLGAHLADGTTVMHEGFVNFNAGTLGTSMIEGRVSAGVVIGVGSDVGGGASIMGTLSGGGRITNSVGRRSLLGANAGLGFPLGDDCVVEAGLYVTAGTKVTVVPGTFDGADALAGRDVVKGGELSGLPGLLLRRNSVSGAVEVLRRPGTGVDLNPALHAN